MSDDIENRYQGVYYISEITETPGIHLQEEPKATKIEKAWEEDSMLKIYFGEMENVLHNVETYFNNQYRYEWLEDPFVVDLIKDVDQSVVESPECIKSPVLRQIPPTRLSGGTKAVILMKYLPDRVINASNCGNNCAPWILKLGEGTDLTINLHHIMEFKKESFEIEILNDHSFVHNMAEVVYKATDFL